MRDYTYRNIPVVLSLSSVIGGTVQQIGWFFLCIGTILSVSFLKKADLSFKKYGDGTLIVEAVIAERENTRVRVNRTRVKKYTYTFSDSEGSVKEGVSYSRTSYKPGRKIEIEYDPESGWSRAKGMTSQPFGPEIMFVLLFPAIGFLLIFIPMIFAWKKIKLLKTGVLTTGEMCDKKPTNMRVNRQPIYKYTFKFTDSRGREHFHTEKTHCAGEVEDEHRERILYLPEFPEVACLVDVIGSKLDFDERGNFIGYSSGKALVRLIIPVISMMAILITLATVI